MSKNYKISFCITCKGRIQQLRETFPQNRKHNADYPNTEFVILDYDSQDGLEEWVRESFQAEIASGQIRYAKHTPEPFFRMAHAKNMAHRLATGDILCNLDADNVAAPGFAGWLNHTVSANPDTYVWAYAKTLLQKVATAKPPAGIGGRIAILRDHFYALRGYDERYNGWGEEDTSFTLRARRSGLKPRVLPVEMYGHVIQHSNDMRLERLSPSVIEESKRRLGRRSTLLRRIASVQAWRNTLGIQKTPPPANPDGRFGCGTVRVNFREEITLEAIS